MKEREEEKGSKYAYMIEALSDSDSFDFTTITRLFPLDKLAGDLLILPPVVGKRSKAGGAFSQNPGYYGEIL